MVILDNSIVSFVNNIDNGIHIPTYFGDRNDKALLNILPLLKHLAKVEDVRSELRKTVGISSLYSSYLKNTSHKHLK